MLPAGQRLKYQFWTTLNAQAATLQVQHGSHRVFVNDPSNGSAPNLCIRWDQDGKVPAVTVLVTDGSDPAGALELSVSITMHDSPDDARQSERTVPVLVDADSSTFALKWSASETVSNDWMAEKFVDVARDAIGV
jgi:hypothetical protein